MRVPKRILLMAALAVVGILGPQATPAHAVAHLGGAVFTGHATLGGGLFTPVSPNCVPGHTVSVHISPSGTSVTTPVPGLCSGNSTTWAISAHGVGVSTSAVPTSIAGPDFSIHASGVLGDGILPGSVHLPPVNGTSASVTVSEDGAWCGWSTGSGNAHWSFSGLANVGGAGHHGSAGVHWQTSAATVLVVTGGGTVAVVDAAANPTTESCLGGNADSFIVVGVAVMATV